MHSQLIFASTKLELADRERNAARRRHAREFRAPGERRRVRLFAGIRRRSATVGEPCSEVSLRAVQKPSV
jgi:hypothetical protein